MRLIPIIFLVLLSLITLNGRSYSQNPASSSAKLFAVIFAFVINEEGELRSFRVSKVIDPGSGSTDAVDEKVPERYIAAARARFMAKDHQATVVDGELKEMFTYFFFDPKQPTRADIGPR